MIHTSALPRHTLGCAISPTFPDRSFPQLPPLELSRFQIQFFGMVPYPLFVYILVNHDS